MTIGLSSDSPSGWCLDDRGLATHESMDFEVPSGRLSSGKSAPTSYSRFFLNPVSGRSRAFRFVIGRGMCTSGGVLGLGQGGGARRDIGPVRGMPHIGHLNLNPTTTQWSPGSARRVLREAKGCLHLLWRKRPASLGLLSTDPRVPYVRTLRGGGLREYFRGPA